MEKLSNSSHFLDLGGLDNLRAQAQKDEKGALKKVAQQFEGIFVQMLMKSMRDANEVFKSDSPMNSQYTAFYEQMRDQQMSVDLSDKGVLGLADMMVQQLSPETSGMTPASALRGNDAGMAMGDKSQEIALASRGHVKDNNDEANALNVHAQLHRNRLAPDEVNGVVSTASLAPQVLMPNDVLRASQVASVEVGTPQAERATIIESIVSGKILPSVANRSPSKGFDSRDEFVTRLYPHAEKAAKALGTQPELLIAQSALETGWGQKMVRGNDGEMSNNLFNIKADKRWTGDKAQVSTLEFDHGIAVKQKADFRIYDGIEQSFADFVSFISDGDRYQKAMKVAADPEKFIRALQDAGYATDPQYANKVLQVMKSISSDVKAAVQGAE